MKSVLKKLNVRWILLICVVLLFVAAAIGYKIYSRSRFERLLISLQQEDQKSFELSKDYIKINNEFVTHLNKLNLDDGSSGFDSLKATVNELKRITEQQDAEYKERCENNNEDFMTLSEYDSMTERLWLDTEEKNFKNKMRSLITRSEDINKKDCAVFVADNAWTKQFIDAQEGFLVTVEFNSNEERDISFISPLQKYSESDEVADAELIEQGLHESYVKHLRLSRQVLGNFYDTALAYQNGDIARGDELAAEFERLSNELSAIDPYQSYISTDRKLSQDILKIQRDYHALILDYDKTLEDRYKVKFSKTITTFNVITGALKVHAIDNDGKYVETDSIEKVLSTLSNKKYIQESDRLDTASFNYASNGLGYKIDFTNDITDKIERIEAVGVR